MARIKPITCVNLINVHGLKSCIKEKEYQMLDQVKYMSTIPHYYTLYMRTNLHMKVENIGIEKTYMKLNKIKVGIAILLSEKI